MRKAGAFCFGALAGAVAVLVAQRFLDEYENQNAPAELVEKVGQHLQELEERLQETTETPEASRT